MGRFVVRRLFGLLPVLIAVSFVVVSFIRLIPGDPITMMLGERPHPEVVAQIRALYDLDKPIVYQYVKWMSQVLRGNFGVSFITRTPISRMIINSLGATLMLTSISLVCGTLIGVVAGVISAVNRNTWKDFIAGIVSFIGISTPSFFMGVALILIFCIMLRWLPPTGYISPRVNLPDSLKHMFLPGFALSLELAATTMRMVRTSTLEVLRCDFVRTARAKGLSERIVLYKHVLKNALIPAITVVSLQLAGLLGGATIIESVFAIPGMGRLLLDGIFTRDYPLIQACILMMTVIFVLANLLADILYAVVDPRIRYE